jgi:hypothetical protein
VFILDAGLNIYQWNGSQANGQEKFKASEFCRALDDERKGLATVHVCEESDGQGTEFWKVMGETGPVKSAQEGGADAGSGRPSKKLLRLSDAGGTMTFKLEAEGNVVSSQFDSKDVFVYDNGLEVFVWVGTGASADEKRLGIQYAQNYLTQYKLPPQTPISRIVEGGESDTLIQSLDDALSGCRFKR